MRLPNTHTHTHGADQNSTENNSADIALKLWILSIFMTQNSRHTYWWCKCKQWRLNDKVLTYRKFIASELSEWENVYVECVYTLNWITNELSNRVYVNICTTFQWTNILPSTLELVIYIPPNSKDSIRQISHCHRPQYSNIFGLRALPLCRLKIEDEEEWGETQKKKKENIQIIVNIIQSLIRMIHMEWVASIFLSSFSSSCFAYRLSS